MKSWIVFLFGSAALMTGTAAALAAVPLATPEQDRYAKQAVPPSGKALIYVYRLDDASPQTASELWLNQRASGRLEARTYGMWAAGPGRLEIHAGRADATPLTIGCEAGRIYFVQLSVNADGGIDLRQVPYGVGRAEMREAHFVLDPAVAARTTAATPKSDAPAQAQSQSQSVPASETKAPTPAPAEEKEPEDSGGVTLILKGGSFSLGSGIQNILADNGLGGTTNYQTSFAGSAAAFGIETEWRARGGWAFGGEVLVRTHDFTTVPSVPVGTGSMQVVTALFNTKKYFRPAAIVQPYLGAGVGLTLVSMSGQLTGTVSGYALQAMGGVAFRWQHFGLYTEAKVQMNKLSDVDASGSGLFAGASVQF